VKEEECGKILGFFKYYIIKKIFCQMKMHEAWAYGAENGIPQRKVRLRMHECEAYRGGFWELGERAEKVKQPEKNCI
jgi:hypothetical protein